MFDFADTEVAGFLCCAVTNIFKDETVGIKKGPLGFMKINLMFNTILLIFSFIPLKRWHICMVILYVYNVNMVMFFSHEDFRGTTVGRSEPWVRLL